MPKPKTAEMLEAALMYASMAQPVFPCKRKGEQAKAPYTRYGLNDASQNEDQIRRWWKQHDDAVIGLPTGIKWDVLDVDVKNDVDGSAHLSYLQRLGLLNGCKRVVRTPSGGWHLYFLPTPDLGNKKSASLGMDVRAKGGYVLAPPSHIKTPQYKGQYVDYGETEGSNNDPLLWDLIVSALAPVNEDTREPIELLPSERRASVAALREWLLMRQAGERNNALHWVVNRCLDNGIDPHEMEETALEIGLGEHETRATIQSAIRRSGVDASRLKSEAESLFGS